MYCMCCVLSCYGPGVPDVKFVHTLRHNNNKAACAYALALIRSGNTEIWQEVCAGLSHDQAGFLQSVICRMLLHNAAGFERRIVQPLREWPFKLLRMIMVTPDCKCSTRVELADEILSTDDRLLEINVRKLKRTYHADLQSMARTGCCGSRLYWCLKGISMLWKSDVRENERINKMLGLLNDRCPNMNLDLKSARISLKYILGEAGEGTGKSRVKWSQYKPVAERIRSQCLSCWDLVNEVQSNPDRWLPNKAATNIAWRPAAEINAAVSKLRPHTSNVSMQYAWAASYGMYLHKQLRGIVDPVRVLVIRFDVKASGQRLTSTFWVAAEKVRNRYIMCPAQFDNTSHQLTWDSLQGFTPLVQCIKSYYTHVKQGDSVVVKHALVDGGKNGHAAASVPAEVGSTAVLPSHTCDAIMCGYVNRFTTLIQLSPPSAAFMKTLADSEDTCKVAKTQADDAATAVQPVAVAAVADDPQKSGLFLLAEEVESCESSAECSDLGDGRDCEEDLATSDNLGPLLRQGIAEACFPDVFNDDHTIEKHADQWLRDASGERVAEEYERELAQKAINKNLVDLQDPRQQSAIEKLSTEHGIDPVDAAVELAVAASLGMQPDMGDTDGGAVDSIDHCASVPATSLPTAARPQGSFTVVRTN